MAYLTIFQNYLQKNRFLKFVEVFIFTLFCGAVRELLKVASLISN